MNTWRNELCLDFPCSLLFTIKKKKKEITLNFGNNFKLAFLVLTDDFPLDCPLNVLLWNHYREEILKRNNAKDSLDLHLSVC